MTQSPRWIYRDLQGQLHTLGVLLGDEGTFVLCSGVQRIVDHWRNAKLRLILAPELFRCLWQCLSHCVWSNPTRNSSDDLWKCQQQIEGEEPLQSRVMLHRWLLERIRALKMWAAALLLLQLHLVWSLQLSPFKYDNTNCSALYVAASEKQLLLRTSSSFTSRCCQRSAQIIPAPPPLLSF